MQHFPIRRYFAYGSNMDPEQMHYRCPGASVIDTATLAEHRFIINRQGFASVVPVTACNVFGVLWEITPIHERMLDDYEGIDEELYYKTTVAIKLTTAGIQQVLIYIAGDQVEGVPQYSYMHKIVAAAEFFRFPKAYVRELQSWLPTRRGDRGRR
jgi:hypothetical protein